MHVFSDFWVSLLHASHRLALTTILLQDTGPRLQSSKHCLRMRLPLAAIQRFDEHRIYHSLCGQPGYRLMYDKDSFVASVLLSRRSERGSFHCSTQLIKTEDKYTNVCQCMICNAQQLQQIRMLGRLRYRPNSSTLILFHPENARATGPS
jgi:hypothetical protein